MTIRRQTARLAVFVRQVTDLARQALKHDGRCDICGELLLPLQHIYTETNVDHGNVKRAHVKCVPGINTERTKP